jgi:hypothetical protein
MIMHFMYNMLNLLDMVQLITVTFRSVIILYANFPLG